MAHAQFVVSDTNPNDTHGGGGCICDPVKQADCKPPYCVFTDNFLEDPRSPVVVVGAPCARLMGIRIEGEALSIGERGYDPPVVDAEVVDEDDAPDV